MRDQSLWEYKQCLEFLIQVIKQELKKLSQKLSKETELEKDMYRKMLGTKASQPIASQSQQVRKTVLFSRERTWGFSFYIDIFMSQQERVAEDLLSI